jgi:hypothetical protein
VLCTGASAEEAFRPFAAEPLPPFVDCRGEAVPGSEIAEEDEADFRLNMLEVLRGLEKARDLSWVDYRIFDVEDHSSSLRPERGDMSWLLPGRALALASPWAEPHDQDGLPVCTPALLCPYFLRHGVSLVVQCNNAEREEEGERRRLLRYEPQSFRDVGIDHLFMPFEDGGCPSVELLLQFLAEVEAFNGAFAVHCRSGLGRTATLIGIYAIRHFGFTARSFIGWARAMRPGTVHGSQQQYLLNLERFLIPGATCSLHDLNERERLQLLPRRELRFWALDCGISPAHTRQCTEDDMIDMILQVRGIQIPRAPPAPAAKPAGPPPARSLMPVLRTSAQVQGTGQLLPKPTGPKLVPSAPVKSGKLPEPALVKRPAVGNSKAAAVERKIEAPAKAAAAKEVDKPAPTAKPVAKAAPGASEVTDRLNSLNAAIASLGRSLHSSSVVANGQGAKQSPPLTAIGASKPNTTAKIVDTASGDEWAEVLRYLHLHAAMQEGNDAWENVTQTIELLRVEAQKEKVVRPSQHVDSKEDHAAAVAKVSEALQKTKQQSADSERELRAFQQQAQSMQRDNSQLRTKLKIDKEAQLEKQAKMEERGEALVAGLQSDELRLEGAVREVEELRGQVLKRGDLKQQQVECVEQLRRDIAEARAVTLHHSVRSKELRSRLGAAATV